MPRLANFSSIREACSKIHMRYLEPYSKKEIAERIGVSEDTAKGWKAGNLPSMSHALLLADWLGPQYIEDFFRPVFGRGLDLQRSLDHLINAATALRRSIKSGAASLVVLLALAGGASGIIQPADNTLRSKTARMTQFRAISRNPTWTAA